MADNGLRGLDDMCRRLRGKLSGHAMQPAAAAAADVLLQHARELIPVASGETKGALEVVFDIASSNVTAHVQVAASGPGLPEHQAIFLEYGTSKMAAQPFMRPAFELGAKAAQDAAVAAIQTIITS